MLAATSCGPPQLPSGPTPTTPSSLGDKYRCENVTGASEPWLVEWDPAAKVRLQSESQSGVLLVRYEGCSLEVLYGCAVEGGYKFTPTTRARNTEYINSEDELFAKLPIGALKLAGEFHQGDRWSLDYVLVGTRDASVKQVERAALSGRCAGATHFVQGMVVGAYRLGSTAGRQAQAELSVYKAGVGGSSESAAGLIRQDGTYNRCVDDATPASDPACQAIVQLYLHPLADGAVSLAQAPAGGGTPAAAAPASGGASEPGYYDNLGSKSQGGPPPPKTASDTRQYKADLEKAWAAVRKAMKGAPTEQQLELYQRFLTDFPVDNPYADKARKEAGRLDVQLTKQAEADAKAAQQAAQLATEKARAAEIRTAYETAKNTTGSASSRLANWQRFVSSYPGEDNLYLSTAQREIAKLEPPPAPKPAPEPARPKTGIVAVFGDLAGRATRIGEVRVEKTPMTLELEPGDNAVVVTEKNGVERDVAFEVKVGEHTVVIVPPPIPVVEAPAPAPEPEPEAASEEPTAKTKGVALGLTLGAAMLSGEENFNSFSCTTTDEGCAGIAASIHAGYRFLPWLALDIDVAALPVFFGDNEVAAFLLDVGLGARFYPFARCHLVDLVLGVHVGYAMWHNQSVVWQPLWADSSNWIGYRDEVGEQKILSAHGIALEYSIGAEFNVARAFSLGLGLDIHEPFWVEQCGVRRYYSEGETSVDYCRDYGGHSEMLIFGVGLSGSFLL